MQSLQTGSPRTQRLRETRTYTSTQNISSARSTQDTQQQHAQIYHTQPHTTTPRTPLYMHTPRGLSHRHKPCSQPTRVSTILPGAFSAPPSPLLSPSPFLSTLQLFHEEDTTHTYTSHPSPPPPPHPPHPPHHPARPTIGHPTQWHCLAIVREIVAIARPVKKNTRSSAPTVAHACASAAAKMTRAAVNWSRFALR